ncbi:MAG: hypothetical protein K8953_00745, partial [Proteobacteria bacterium]|nr:hypothetical protein [Pseudomonadota bacterium]
ASRTDTVSKFLKGRAGDLDTGGIRVLANGNVNYSGTLTFGDGLFFHGDAADGVAFFAAEKVNGRFLSYAGILSGTDLGAPVTQTQGVAEWLGSFQFEGYSATDFTLNVVFGGGDEAGLINAIVQDYTNNDFHVAGSFDDTGVITGNVYLGTFRVNQDPISYGIVKYTAELAGLIGQQGAVGAFVGSTSSTTGFAGGFIAAPDGEGYTVRTSDWLASFDTEPVSIPTDRNSQFLKASATGFNVDEMPGVSTNSQQLAVLTLADNFADGTSLGGHGADGVAFFGRKIDDAYYRYYAGILANTDLGLPLEPEGTPTYEWQGVFQAVGSGIIKTDFTLRITYTGGNYAGRISAFIDRGGDYYYQIWGNFSHGGLIVNGMVNHWKYTAADFYDPIISGRRAGVLTGLIGQEGAIGAFIANSNSTSGYYSGGFVAKPNFVDVTPESNRVTRADWRRSFEGEPYHAVNVNRNHFLQIPNALPSAIENVVFGTTTNSKSFTNISPYFLTLDDDIFQDGGGSATDGMVFYKAHNGDESDSYFYAGILHGTDLGAPLSETSGTATWNGRFQAVLSGSVLREFSRDFTLDITFNATGGDISTIVSGRTEDYFELDGTFNKQGVISGTANHVYYENGRIGGVTGDIVNSGPVAGLIGQQGAVGMFISNRQTGNTGGFAGGFVARPPSE